MCRVDREGLEATLSAWAEARLGEAPVLHASLEGMAIDGKTRRRRKKQGAPSAHRLAALAHRVGLTLMHLAVADQTNEMPIVIALLRHLVRAGRVVTRDALLTPRQIAH